MLGEDEVRGEDRTIGVDRRGRDLRVHVWLGLQVLALGVLAVATGSGPAVVVPIVAGSLVVAILIGRRISLLAAAREQATAQVVAEQARVHAMLAGSNDLTVVVTDERISYQSPASRRVTGHEPESLLGVPYLDLVHEDDRESVLDVVHELLAAPGASALIACRLQAADGSYLPVEIACRNLLHDPAVGGFVATARDVSERDELQQQLEHAAFHDPLTGLPNRALLLDRLGHSAERLARTGGHFAVLYVDLDNFKTVNDRLGHAAGDEVLRETGRRLLRQVRGSDTVARLGVDEFAILVEEPIESVDAARVARRVLDAVQAPVTIGETADADAQVTASVGIAYDHDGTTPAEVLRNADTAMHFAKRDGKDRFEVFEPRMHAAVVERLHLEADLQVALDRGTLDVHYQPIVTLADQRTTGVEALVRWNHPARGSISPGVFVPIAEETGQVVKLGQFVLHRACRQIAEWRRTIPGAEDLHVSVNVSMRQFVLGDLLRDVAEALGASGLPSEALTLELTESALVQNTDRTLHILGELKALGVRLAIDDFGTGYSSLAYLHRFPVDELKIDRSFVTSVVSGHQSPALARAIVDLGRSLDLITVAEGIEHDTELAQFRELECTLGQGYLFARPADAADTEKVLRAAFAGPLPLASGT